MTSDKLHSKRPANTAFKQQRLKAWEPILTPGPVILAFILIGIAFVIVGAFMLRASNKVIEHSIRYDNIVECQPDINSGHVCDVTFDITEEMESPVYLYYRLDNFYQNHRRYVKSRNDDQLKGTVVTDFNKLDDCDPMVTADGSKNVSQILVPCGLIANSMFNDTFQLFDQNGQPINLKKEGIAWSSDVEKKFGVYPKDGPGIINPRFNGDFTDEDFIVWMRTAALPDFKKLYRIIETPLSGKVTVKINNFYPVSSFDGKKYVVLSTATWIGGKNPFLGYAYIIVGVICFVQGIVFLVKHYFSPRKLGDTKFLDWNSNK